MRMPLFFGISLIVTDAGAKYSGGAALRSFHAEQSYDETGAWLTATWNSK
ncbi:MAG: hypothetical protein GF331_09630 [Chitinivibrionales bacterium]|nr:hypothetical protein [Chitinivibrionales bacterium]